MSANINPLANPKGANKVCELCEKPAYIQCTKCFVTFYCGKEHQEDDWVAIHKKVCQLLIPVRTPVPYYTLEAEREQHCSQILERQKLLMEVSQRVAEKKLFEKRHKESLPAALLSLRSAMDIYGTSGVQLVPAYLLLAEANIGLGNLSPAEQYLSWADWTVVRTPDCSRTVRHKLHRCMGRLFIVKGNLEGALFHLANDIYYASEEYGQDSIVTCGGYYLMADVFFRQGKMDIVNSLYTEVANTWHTHLSRLLEKHIENTITPEESFDEAQQAEADQMLRSMLDVPDGCPEQQPNQSAALAHSLGMLWLLGGDPDKALEFGKRALLSSQLVPDCSLTEPIQRLLQLAEEDLNAAKKGWPDLPHYPSAHTENQHSAQCSGGKIAL
ncbi:zinc finger MYND domain-containing protein 12 isoform X1 [Anguilla anguilla]|uniref:zinc finger MYND domain-containing protein 12 isoform X1 n=1 Tax=Anguilla anguilla TaxID=7936 RepID=UPI0015AC3137|nr:zinc finger MYND domain-containing protein 12 isoform X1 [Anguilla anguilla]